MKPSKRHKKTAFTKKIRLIIITSIVLVMCVAAINAFILAYTRQQTFQYLDNMATLYVQELDDNFFKIGRRLVTILMGDEGTQKDINDQFNILENSKDVIQRKTAIDQLRDNFLEYTWEYGPEYQFFSYLDQTDTYIRLNNFYAHRFDDQLIKHNIIQLINLEQANTYSIKKKWDVMSIGDENYLVKLMKTNDRYLGCFVKADALLKSLESLSSNSGSLYLLVDQQDHFITGHQLTDKQRDDIQKILQKRNVNHWLSKYVVLDKPFKRIPYHVKICIANNGIFTNVIIVQSMLIALTIMVLGTLSFIMIYLRKSVLKPIQVFTKNLSAYDDDNFVFNISDNKIKELEAANEQFRHLLRQIKKMKVTLYENEIKRQNIHMEYLQLQIKPHFYLNCLSFIHQTIDLGHYDKAQKMIRTTSDYLRYLFSNGMDHVYLKDELRHVKNYLDIYKMRYQSAFSYHIEQDKRTDGCYIVPLIIQTFVENAIKHTVTLDQKIHISVVASMVDDQDKSYVKIAITDTGVGFPIDVLTKLQKGENIKQEGGERVGIMNSLNRLHYFYGDDASIQFSNNPTGGSSVEIMIPFHLI